MVTASRFGQGGRHFKLKKGRIPGEEGGVGASPAARGGGRHPCSHIDHPQVFPPSPLSNGGGGAHEVEEATRGRKPKDKKNGRKRLKKKYKVRQSDEDNTSQQHNVANGGNVMALLESESDDILTILSLCTSATSKKLDEGEENANKETSRKINNEVEDGVNFSTMVDPVVDSEVKRQPDQNESILQSAEVGLEIDTKPAKKNKKQSEKDKELKVKPEVENNCFSDEVLKLDQAMLTEMEVDKSSHDIHMKIKEDRRTEIDKQSDQHESLLHSVVEDSKGGADLKKKKKKMSKEDKELKAGVEDDTVRNWDQFPQSESKADQSIQDITTENEVDQRTENDLGEISLFPSLPSVKLVYGLPAKSMVKKKSNAKAERSVGAESLSHGSVYREDKAQLDDVEGEIIENNVALKHEGNQKQANGENSLLPLNPDDCSKPKKKRKRSAEDKIIETDNGIDAIVILKDKPNQDEIKSDGLDHNRSLQNEQNESTFDNNAADQFANEDHSRQKRKKKKTSETQENSKALNVEESKRSFLTGTKDNNADKKSSQLGALSNTLLRVDMETRKQDQKVATPGKKECLPMAIKGVEDRCTQSDLLHGFAPTELSGKSIMDSEDGAYLEWKRCETCLADSVHQRFGERAREAVAGLMASQPLMLTCKGSDNYTESSGKQETNNEAIDVTKRKTVVQRFQRVQSNGLLLERRVSPRLKNAPKDKRPYYGCNQNRRLNATAGLMASQPLMLTCKGSDNYIQSSGKQETNNEAIDVTKRKTVVQRFQRVQSNGLLLERRVSPRLKNVPKDKRPYYGCNQNRRLNATAGLMALQPLMLTCKGSDNYTESSGKQETNNEAIDVTKGKIVVQRFQKVQSNGLLLERRVSPRLKNVPKDKRLDYGSNQNRQLNATEDYAQRNNDQKRKLYSKDNTTKENTKVDCMMQKCLINVARKDISDADVKSWLSPDSGSVKYEMTEMVDLENCGSSKLTGHRRFVADHMCQRTGVRMKQMDYFEKERAPEASSRFLGLVCEDISNGLEDIPIPVTNMIDPPLAPTDFTYIKSFEVARNVILPPSPPGCNCKGNCTNPKTCSCARLNGSDFPYVRKDGGRLTEPKDVLFECGPGCGCGPNCINRISQRGIKYRLEVYRTQKKGWAVRSLDFIPSGAPVCEYIGVLRRCSDLDNISENDYIFEIDCWHTMHGIGGRERRQGDASKDVRHLVEKVDEAESEAEFCVDGASYSNVTRFINHSCDPNLFVQCVLSSHHDIRFARIVLFAADDIPPMQELSYDYGYALDSVTDRDGKIKKSPCYCGASECRGRLY